MQNLVVVSHIVCVHVSSLKNLGGGAQCGDPLETCFSHTCLIMPISVILHETVGA